MDRYEALKHAVKAHAGQLDKCGQPYILHPIAVAEAAARADIPELQLAWTYGSGQEDAEVVALLHDVWEDTSYNHHNGSLTAAQQAALERMTRQPGQSYDDYIECICVDPFASIVKLADLAHNLSPERQACLPEREQRSLGKRYLKARDQIWAALGAEWWPEGGER